MYKICIILCFSPKLVFGGTVPYSGFGLSRNFSSNGFPKSEYAYINDEYYNNYYSESGCALTAFPPTPDSMCCGIDVSTNNRIVGGSETLLNQYPWLARIEYESIGQRNLVSLCGGSLISGFYVLTAAHCVAGEILETNYPRNVVLGDYNKNYEGQDCVRTRNGGVICTKGKKRIPIKQYWVHEYYKRYNRFNDDIALIKLAKQSPYTDSIRPICLPTSDINMSYQENIWLSVAGWGAMMQEYNGENFINTYADVKRRLQVAYVPLAICQWSYTEDIQHGMVCAGGEAGANACSGDSGGPLMLNNGGSYELTGIVSFGMNQPCGLPNYPEVYTNVYQYKEWIMNIIKSNF